MHCGETGDLCDVAMTMHCVETGDFRNLNVTCACVYRPVIVVGRLQHLRCGRPVMHCSQAGGYCCVIVTYALFTDQ